LIFRAEWLDIGRRSNDYWIYDGANLTQVGFETDDSDLSSLGSGDKPSYITVDHDGTILYGSGYFIRKTGPHGWVYGNPLNLPTYSYSSAPCSAFIDPDVVDPPDPIYTDPDFFEDQAFQILCTKGWIQLRGFRGNISFASGPVTLPERPEFVMARYEKVWDGAAFVDDPTNNCRQGQGAAGRNIPGWSLSHDGTIRVPHLQAMSAYPPNSVDDETLRRMHARTYVDQDCSEWEPTGGEDQSGSFPERLPYWPKWRSCLPPTNADQNGFMKGYWPWLEEWGEFPALQFDVFISANNHVFDWDIVDCGECGCTRATFH
jgi:hypothetical protein